MALRPPFFFAQGDAVLSVPRELGVAEIRGGAASVFVLLCQYLYFCTRICTFVLALLGATVMMQNLSSPCIQRPGTLVAAHTATYGGIRQHTAAYVSLRQHTLVA